MSNKMGRQWRCSYGPRSAHAGYGTSISLQLDHLQPIKMEREIWKKRKPNKRNCVRAQGSISKKGRRQNPLLTLLGSPHNFLDKTILKKVKKFRAAEFFSKPYCISSWKAQFGQNSRTFLVVKFLAMRNIYETKNHHFPMCSHPTRNKSAE